MNDCFELMKLKRSTGVTGEFPSGLFGQQGVIALHHPKIGCEFFFLKESFGQTARKILGVGRRLTIVP